LRRGSDINSEGEVQFGSGDVCQLAGVSRRQLQWWAERKIISPRQEGHRRLYASADVIAMMTIAELRRKGLSLQKIRRIVRPVRREIQRKLDQLVSGNSELYLVTDGKTSQFEHESARVIELLRNSLKPLALVSMSDMAKRMAEFPDTAGSRNLED
jgi:DNA-binding transcriptional MerR regulator